MDIKIPTKLFGVDGKRALERILSEPDTPSRTEPQEQASSIIHGPYDIINKLTYGQAMEVLRQDYAAGRIPNHPTCQSIQGKTIRPLTMKETALARLEAYETLHNPDGSLKTKEERLALFNQWVFTTSGIMYKKNSTLFKILPTSIILASIAEDYTEASIPINYESAKVAELDSSKAKHNALLGLSEILNHKAWIETFEWDTTSLEEYAKAVLQIKKQKPAMAYWVLSNPNKDELRALALSGLRGNSLANGDSDLDGGACFVRVNPSL